MKLTSRISPIFILVTLALTLLSANSLTASPSTTNPNSPHEPTNHARTTAAGQRDQVENQITPIGSATNQAIFTFAEDHHALLSTRFTMRRLVYYRLTIAPTFRQPIRKASIRRKGALRG